MVEAAAVHLPGGAVHALVHLLALPEREIERDEIEGRADPSDADDQVGPADDEIEPVGDEEAAMSIS
jgi:hypothetical protein